MYLCFSVLMICLGRMCVLRLADLCVCELSQSQHQLKEGTLREAQLFVFQGFVMVCVGVACF